MSAPVPSSLPVVRFGAFEADLRAGELRKNGLKVKLPDQPFRVLAALLGASGQVVTREDLRRQVWPADTFIDFDHGLNLAIAKIRVALGDDAENPRFIATIPRRGYKFLVPVTLQTGEPFCGVSPSAAGKLSFGRIWLFGVAGLLVAAAAFLAVRKIDTLKGLSNSNLPQIRAIAVLPLEDLSHDREQEYFAEGMTDELINKLGQAKALRVVSRTSVMRFKGSHKPLPEIAKVLNVDAILEGAVLHRGGRVRISAELVDGKSDRQLWAQSYERDIGDVLKLQNNVADAITREIQIALTPQERRRFREAVRVNPDAFDAYLRGQFYWNRFSKEGMWQAISYFQKAIEKQPDWAPPYAGLAHSYHELSWYVPPKQVMPQAKAAAEKAIGIDPDLAEAHAALAWVRWVYEWDWTGAESEFKRALDLNPNSSLAHGQYALFLDASGRSEQALQEERIALQLDPLSLIINTNMGEILLQKGQNDQAMRQLLMTIAMDPQFGGAHAALAEVYAQAGQFDKAVSEVRLGYRTDPDPQYLGWLAWLYAVSGEKEQAQKTLQELQSLSTKRYVPASSSAAALAALGNKKLALTALEQGARERDSNLAFFRLDESSFYRGLRSEPRFQMLLRQIRVP